MLDRWFRVAAAGSTVRREVGAGLVTYLTLCYRLPGNQHHHLALLFVLRYVFLS